MQWRTETGHQECYSTPQEVSLSLSLDIPDQVADEGEREGGREGGREVRDDKERFVE